jgi:hypothetical protein
VLALRALDKNRGESVRNKRPRVGSWRVISAGEAPPGIPDTATGSVGWVSRNVRSLGVTLAAFLGASLALSACSSSPTPGVLTSADIPSHLGVKANPSATADYASRLTVPQSCKTVGVAVFSVPGMRLNEAVLPTSAHTTAVTSVVLSCASESETRTSFGTAVGASVPGIGDEAEWLNEGVVGGGRFYAILWRKNDKLGNVSVAGPTNDSHIGPGLAVLLARRAAAES